MFTRRMLAGWADVDFNGHMRNTAFLDKATDVRMMFFAAQGFSASDFARLRVGPVARKDEVEYFREIRLLDEFDVTFALAAMADDGSRFRLRNEFSRADGEICARVTSTGGWLDLTARKLTVPPELLLEAMRALARTGDFAVLPSSVRAR